MFVLNLKSSPLNPMVYWETGRIFTRNISFQGKLIHGDDSKLCRIVEIYIIMYL